MLKGWRTRIWNLANAIVPILELVRDEGVIPEHLMPYWLLLYVVGNLILREVTTTPPGKSS
jgi:hypothetical protein